MDESTSRNEAVNALMELIEARRKWMSGEKEIAGLDAGICALIDLPSVEIVPRWIPCWQRLPELDEDGYSDKVLVCFRNYSFMEICKYRTNKWYAGDTEDSPEDIGLEVEAWMPLPEPYKGGPQNEEC